MTKAGYYVLGLTKAQKSKIMERDLKVTLFANGEEFVIPHIVIYTFLHVQVANKFNSLNYWPMKFRNLLIRSFKPYINAGGSISVVAKCTGVYPNTLRSWGL